MISPTFQSLVRLKRSCKNTTSKPSARFWIQSTPRKSIPQGNRRYLLLGRRMSPRGPKPLLRDCSDHQALKEQASKRVKRVTRSSKQAVDPPSLIRLNKFLSSAGISSRRKADELILSGTVTVNGERVTSLGSKVDPSKDRVYEPY